MTRITNMEHVEVLERLRARWAMPGEYAALDAAIAALSAPSATVGVDEAKPGWCPTCGVGRSIGSGEWGKGVWS